MYKFDFENKERWKKVRGGSYKLLKPDIDKDRHYTEMKFKALEPSKTEDGRVSIAGIANAYVMDRSSEIVDPRGLDATNFLKNPQLLAHHSYNHPIGQVDTLEVTEQGVHFEAWIGDASKAELTEMQKEIRSLVKQGILKTVSIGFLPKKVKPPIFADSGELQEPAIIEQWELLELSIVSIPCNQDSIFSQRALQDDNNQDKILIEKIINFKLVLAEKSEVVQSLIFSKDIFSKDQAMDWAKTHDYVCDKITEDDKQFILEQLNEGEFEKESLNTQLITEGVFTVSGKLKKEMPVDAAPAPENEPQDNEVLTVCKGIADTCQKIYDMCDAMAQKAAPMAEDKPKEDKPKDEEKSIDKVDILQKQVGKLTEIVVALVGKIHNQ